jgi:uncharacterized protein YeaO (DUF488 family)
LGLISSVKVIKVKRAYEPAEPSDGRRYLVDRLWPRGIKKEDLPLDGWLKDVAPSNELRRWFGHDPARWEGFAQRYYAELEDNPAVRRLLDEGKGPGDVTLVYGARDPEHNQAVALRAYMLDRLAENP